MSLDISIRYIIDDLSYVLYYISDLNVVSVQQRLKSIYDAVQNTHQLQLLITFLIVGN